MRKIIILSFSLLLLAGISEAQWNVNGTHIYNSNTGNVGIGNSTPATLLEVGKNMTEPVITVHNFGGIGGATYSMIDNASGANWKFKATSLGGFKIRDHSNLLDVFVIEPNSAANAIYIKSGGNVGMGTSTPNNSAILDLQSTNQGILVPRLTAAQMLAIPSPATGLLVFNTGSQAFYSYNGTLWAALNAGTPNMLKDANNDTKIQVEKNPNEDIIRFDLGGTEKMILIGNRLELLNPQSNTFIGGGAGQSNIGGYWNVGIGNGSLSANIGGAANTAVGQTSLASNTSGVSNTAVGCGTQYINQTGSFNTALGAFALFSNLSGTHNTALGSYALNANTGLMNTAVGADALKNNSTGGGNTATGYQALMANTQATGNTATGSNTLLSNTLGSNNTANGWGALYSNTTAGQNIAIGNYALYTQSFNNGGSPYNSNNVAVGYHALAANQPTSQGFGSQNTATGNYALQSNTNGLNNTANGFYALNDNTGGYNNTAIGAYALYQNTGGSYNTAIGRSALNDNIGGSYNTAIGNAAYFPGTNLNNTTCIGFNSGIILSADNRIEIGNASVSWIGGQVNWGIYSDGRIKDNVTEDVPGLSFINKLRPVTYNLNIHKQNSMVYGGKKEETDWPSKYDIEKIKMTGFVAQEVEQAANEVGYNFSGVQRPANPEELYSLRYAEFVVPLVKAMQELSSQYEVQKIVYESQQILIEDLKTENSRLEERLISVESKLSAK